MAEIVQTPEHLRAEGREIITRDNRFGVGIDVGWRVGGLDLWWGNTRNAQSLVALIEDARRTYGDFRLSRETEQRIRAGEEQ